MAMSKSTSAGDLRHPITIIQAAITSDQSGQVEDWENPSIYVRAWAEIAPASANDIIRSGQTVSQVMIPITMRYYPGITSNMRVQYNDNTYIIKGILIEEERILILTLMCLALGNNE